MAQCAVQYVYADVCYYDNAVVVRPTDKWVGNVIDVACFLYSWYALVDNWKGIRALLPSIP